MKKLIVVAVLLAVCVGTQSRAQGFLDTVGPGLSRNYRAVDLNLSNSTTVMWTKVSPGVWQATAIGQQSTNAILNKLLLLDLTGATNTTVGLNTNIVLLGATSNALTFAISNGVFKSVTP